MKKKYLANYNDFVHESPVDKNGQEQTPETPQLAGEVNPFPEPQVEAFNIDRHVE